MRVAMVASVGNVAGVFVTVGSKITCDVGVGVLAATDDEGRIDVGVRVAVGSEVAFGVAEADAALLRVGCSVGRDVCVAVGRWVAFGVGDLNGATIAYAETAVGVAIGGGVRTPTTRGWRGGAAAMATSRAGGISLGWVVGTTGATGDT